MGTRASQEVRGLGLQRWGLKEEVMALGRIGRRMFQAEDTAYAKALR